MFDAPDAWNGLVTLKLSATRVGPIRDLRSCKLLHTVEIDHVDQPDLEFLDGIKKLKMLSIAHTGVESLAPIRKSNLESLDLRWSLVRSLDALQAHQWTLRRLALDVEQAAFLAALRDMLITHVVIEGRDRGGEIEANPLRWLDGIKHLEDVVLVDCRADPERVAEWRTRHPKVRLVF